MSASKSEVCIPGPDRVMCVGLACVDFVNVVTSFPQEDSDQRGEKYHWQRGGNATNNCTVLAKLATPCDFMGVLGTKGAEAQWIAEDFERCGISIAHCVKKDVQCSIATVLLSIKQGTRTIVFYPRDQPQLTFDEFDKEFNGDFSAYSWIHFEVGSAGERYGKEEKTDLREGRWGVWRDLYAFRPAYNFQIYYMKGQQPCRSLDVPYCATDSASQILAYFEPFFDAAEQGRSVFRLTSNVTDVCSMIESVLASRSKCKFDKTQAKSGEDQDIGSSAGKLDQYPLVSLEIEKPEISGAEKSLKIADVVFISKDFAKSRGCSHPVVAVKKFHGLCKPWATVICAWGEEGAAACFGNTDDRLFVVSSPALTDIVVVDSLGAGDSFIAAVIHMLVKRSFRPGGRADRVLHEHILEEALWFGCRVAGVKCTGFGYESIADITDCGSNQHV